jgi:hypothetical protein
VQTIDQRKNQDGIGTVYGGILNMGFPAIVKKELKMRMVGSFTRV